MLLINIDYHLHCFSEEITFYLCFSNAKNGPNRLLSCPSSFINLQEIIVLICCQFDVISFSCTLSRSSRCWCLGLASLHHNRAKKICFKDNSNLGKRQWLTYQAHNKLVRFAFLLNIESHFTYIYQQVRFVCSSINGMELKQKQIVDG